MLSDRGDEVLYNHRFDASVNSISLSDEQTERQSPVVGFGLANGGIGIIELMRNKSKVLWQLEPIQMQDGECAPVSIVKCCKLDKKAGQ